MDCAQVKLLIQDFLDSELPPDMEQAFESHVSDCRACRETLGQYSAVDSDLRIVFNEMRAPERLAYKVNISIRNAAIAPRPRPRYWLGPVAAAAACAVIGLAVWMAPEKGSEFRVQSSGAGDQAQRGAASVYDSVEPQGTGPYAIGAAYVITPDGPKPYKGRTRIRIVRDTGGCPTLLVDAFPEREVMKRRNTKKRTARRRWQ
jgi:hypothetical protein